MHATMRIAASLGVDALHRFEHASRLLSGSCAIEVDYGFSCDEAS